MTAQLSNHIKSLRREKVILESKVFDLQERLSSANDDEAKGELESLRAQLDHFKLERSEFESTKVMLDALE